MPEPPAESLAWVHGSAKVKRLALPVGLLVGLTAISGAFAAGNDAEHAFNTFPMMGDSWIPDDIFEMKHLFRNFFENTSTVQLDHRILATTTLISVGALWWSTRKLDIHPAIRSLMGSTAGMAALQTISFWLYVNYSISKLEEALTINHKNHEALWCLENAHTSRALLTLEQEMVRVDFNRACEYYRQAVDEDPGNELYGKSLEMAMK